MLELIARRLIKVKNIRELNPNINSKNINKIQSKQLTVQWKSSPN